MVDLECLTLKSVSATVDQQKHGSEVLAFKLILKICTQLAILYIAEQILNDKEFKDPSHPLEQMIVL